MAQCYCSIQMLFWLSKRYVQVNSVEVDPSLISVLCASYWKITLVKLFVCHIHSVTSYKGEVNQVKRHHILLTPVSHDPTLWGYAQWIYGRLAISSDPDYGGRDLSRHEKVLEWADYAALLFLVDLTKMRIIFPF